MGREFGLELEIEVGDGEYSNGAGMTGGIEEEELEGECELEGESGIGSCVEGELFESSGIEDIEGLDEEVG